MVSNLSAASWSKERCRKSGPHIASLSKLFIFLDHHRFMKCVWTSCDAAKEETPSLPDVEIWIEAIRVAKVSVQDSL